MEAPKTLIGGPISGAGSFVGNNPLLVCALIAGAATVVGLFDLADTAANLNAAQEGTPSTSGDSLGLKELFGLSQPREVSLDEVLYYSNKIKTISALTGVAGAATGLLFWLHARRQAHA